MTEAKFKSHMRVWVKEEDGEPGYFAVVDARCPEEEDADSGPVYIVWPEDPEAGNTNDFALVREDQIEEAV